MPRIRHNLMANILGRAWSFGLAFVLVPVYLHYLGVEAYALVGFQTLLTNVVAMFDLGLGHTLNRELARSSIDPENSDRGRVLLHTLETIYLILGLVFAAAIFAAAGLIADRWLQGRRLPVDTLVTSIRLISASILLQLISLFYQAGLIGLQRQALANGIWAAAAAFRGVLTVSVLAWVAPTLEAFFICQVVALALSAAANRLALTRALGPIRRSAWFQPRMLREVRHFAAGVFGYNLAGGVLTHLDKVLLSRMISLDALGYYMLASTVVQLLGSIVQPVNRAIFPRYTQLWEQADRATLSSLHHASCQLVSIIVMPATVMLTLFARPAMFAWTGQSHVANQTAHLVALLAIGMTCTALAMRFSQLLLASGRSYVPMWVNIASLIAFLPLFAVLVRRWGVIGAAAAWVIATVAGRLLILIPYASRVILKQSPLRWLLADVLAPGAAAATVGLLVRYVVPHPSDRWPLAVFLGGVGVAMSIAAALACGHIRRWVLEFIIAWFARPERIGPPPRGYE